MTDFRVFLAVNEIAFPVVLLYFVRGAGEC